MDVKLPDGTTVNNVPDGMSKADLFSKLKASGHPVSDDWLKTPAPATPAPKSTGFAENAIGSVYEPLAQMATGAIAKPVSDVMGTAAAVKEAISPSAPGSGSPEGFKNWVQEQLTYQPKTPAGKAVAEYNPLAIIGKGVAGAGQGVGNMVRGDAAPGSVRGMAGNAAQEAVNQAPGFLGVKGGKVVPGAARGTAEGLMQSALKPSLKQLKNGQASRAISTMLDQGVNVSKGGVAYLREQIDALNDQIKTAIQGSPEMIDKDAVVQTLNKPLERMKRQVSPNADLAAIKATWDEFMNHPLLTGSQIPVPLAQELKTGTYRALNGKYGEVGAASTEAQKTLARGLKDQIALNVPEIAGLNARESELLNALNMTEKRVLLDANKNPMGLSLLAKNPATWAAFLADKSAGFKSLAARLINKTGQASKVALPPAGIATGVSAMKPPMPRQDEP